jgi:hypothetical protein
VAENKTKLDAEAAWPIGLVYSDAASPFAQHQVLAIGYMENGDGTAVLNVWDNNDGNKPRAFGLDLRGDELQVANSDRPLKGIFLEDYSSRQPPMSLRLPVLRHEEVFWLGGTGDVSSNWRNDNLDSGGLASAVWYSNSQFC